MTYKLDLSLWKKKVQKEMQRVHQAYRCQRAITGASHANARGNKNQKAQTRKAAQEQASRASKEAEKAKQPSKQHNGCCPGFEKVAYKQKAKRPVKVSVPQVGRKH